MALILLGLNHRTSPLDLRERLSLSSTQLTAALSDLYSNYLLATDETRKKQLPSESLHEVLILSTCNRLEMYAVVREPQEGWDALEQFLMQQGSLRQESLVGHLYRLAGHDVVEHLMRVTAGLDSMILGEPQIMGQISDALTVAQEAHTTGAVLSHLFAEALHTGKRAHTETAISRHTASASHAAIQLVQAKVGDLSRAQVLIVGAGEAALLAAKALKMHQTERIICINRTQTKAADLAAEIEGQVLPWQALAGALARSDVLISTTSSPTPIFSVEAMRTALLQRQGRQLIIMDLAVPRDVEPGVGQLPDVYLYDIDDLQAVLDKNVAQRQAAIPHVEAILKEGVETFLKWLHGRQVVPVLTSFRNKVTALADAEVKQALNRMEGLSQQSQRAVVQTVQRIVNKVLHEPTVRLRAYAASGDSSIYIQAIQDLFALDPALMDREQMDCPCSNLR